MLTHRQQVWLMAGLLLFSTVFLIAGRVTDPPDPESIPPAPRSGAPAPDFTLQQLNGETITLSELRGQVVVLNFWATWCPPCRAEMPDMQEITDEYGDDGVVILAVNQAENPERVADFVEEYELTFPVLLDNGYVGSLYDLQAYPSTYFIDRQGQIRYSVFGGPMAKGLMKSYVLQLLEE